MSVGLHLPTRGITWSDDRDEGEDEEPCDSCGQPAPGTLVDDEDGGFVFEASHKCSACRDGLCGSCREACDEDGACTRCQRSPLSLVNKAVLDATFKALMQRP